MYPESTLKDNFLKFHYILKIKKKFDYFLLLCFILFFSELCRQRLPEGPQIQFVMTVKNILTPHTLRQVMGILSVWNTRIAIAGHGIRKPHELRQDMGIWSVWNTRIAMAANGIHIRCGK